MDATKTPITTAEAQRLEEDRQRVKNWKRWGPYLAERQWGTVREDYSPCGTCWDYFTHDQARSRAYRWGEDGLLGITDRECRLCFALALWNGRDPILKERLFGLSGPQGNHGEDVKECYFYLESTPTHSYVKSLYKYPQFEFPYAQLVDENRRRTRRDPEFELMDTGIFDGNRYFDVVAEYAKASPNDILIRLTVANRSSERAKLYLLPTLWFRNTWSWGIRSQAGLSKPQITVHDKGILSARHGSLGEFHLAVDQGPGSEPPLFLFTENETNFARLFGGQNPGNCVKDAFHDYLIHQRTGAVNPGKTGTKAAACYRLELGEGDQAIVRLRLFGVHEAPVKPFGPEFEATFARRMRESKEFYADRVPPGISSDENRIICQAYSGLLISKQFYHYVVKEWLEGDPGEPVPPASRKRGRNHEWTHLYNRDVISMPDKWEFPWYAAWDLAFHMVAMARIDPDYAKEQLVLFLREWYMHPNGQIPAYEFAFSDVNPPVHAWAAWRVFKITGAREERDRHFLARVFQKLVLNFTWWVNRKDPEGNNLFAGGFLGLDNIGLFDQSKPLPMGAHMAQADGTAWMAFYCATMLSIALKLAEHDPAYEDMASKFFEHFVAIADAMNSLGGTGLWDELDGFYYSQLRYDGRQVALRIRSLVGLIPLIAVENLEQEVMDKLPGFTKRMRWFLQNRQDITRHISCLADSPDEPHGRRLLAIPTQQRLERVLRYVLDENEFLSPFGIRSVSRVHLEHPFVFNVDGHEYRVDYEPGEAQSDLFGGNSNWRGPIWMPINYLLIEALERYHHFYGDSFQVECPTGSGRKMNLQQVADDIACRLVRIFLPDASGQRPCHGPDPRFATDPYWRDLLLFNEYFNGETGRGLGASHQTGWTALVARCIENRVRSRAAGKPV
ncbi:MAG: glucosidase [Candidatus Omnitrophica bacterium]|nr:glucosidase [Candidatus Omnitrophota bacterium]